MEIALKIGERLKEIRTGFGIKQKDTAQKLGIPATLLSMYEQGKREPSISFLYKFSLYFNITLCQLFSKIEENKPQKRRNIDSLLLEMKDIINHLEKAASK